MCIKKTSPSNEEESLDECHVRTKLDKFCDHHKHHHFKDEGKVGRRLKRAVSSVIVESVSQYTKISRVMGSTQQ